MPIFIFSIYSGYEVFNTPFRVVCVCVWGGDFPVVCVFFLFPQVDKSKFATNAFDKEFLLGKTFGGSGGRYNPNEDRRKGES